MPMTSKQMVKLLKQNGFYDPSEFACPYGAFIMMIEFDSIELKKRYHKKAVRKNVTIPA